mmetsp:Transcript_22019/g.34173  ORF Transcript_22019/g.34173 Transcript_22019/m.34173 type:complete len:128 (+) Transcript_22019:401-784(+)
MLSGLSCECRDNLHTPGGTLNELAFIWECEDTEFKIPFLEEDEFTLSQEDIALVVITTDMATLFFFLILLSRMRWMLQARSLEMKAAQASIEDFTIQAEINHNSKARAIEIKILIVKALAQAVSAST